MSRDFLNICDLHNTSGTSFRCTEWKENTKYFHNSRYIDFVSLDNCLFMCIKSHISEEDNKPVPEVSVSADTRASVLTLESEYWQLILSGNNVQSFKSGIPEADGGDEVKFLAYENGEMVWKSITATATSVDSTENANVSVGTVTRAASGPIQFTFQIPKGADGKDGVNGSDGKDGVDGQDGQDGEDGVDGADGITPETFLTSYVFKRAAANENVPTPVGGSFSSPYPTLGDGSRDINWHDSIPTGSGNVYVSIGKFSSATTDPVVWSKPVKLSDTDKSQVEYLSNESVNFHGQVINTAAELERVLNAESGGLYPYRFGTYVQGVDLEEAEIRWRNEVRNAGLGIWGDDDTADSPYYMATCTSNDNGATWSAWTVVRIKGERGQNINPRGTLDELPSCNDTTYNYGDSVVLNTDGHLYIHNGNHCNSCNTNQCWVDMGYTRGDTLHVKYANDYRGDNTDADGVFTVTINGTEHTLIWDIDGNVEVGDYIGITLNSSEAPTDPNEYKWQRWTGYDGYGYEYIYWATEKNVKPSITIPEGEDTQTDEYMPCVNNTDKRWLDDAPSVSKEQPYIWRSYRKRIDGVWSNFSEVKLHLQYANGISQTYDFYAILTVDSFEYPTSISELEYEGDLSYGFYFSGTSWLPKIESVNTSDDNDYYVHNITIIKFDNDVYEIKGTCLYKIPQDGGEITKITPYYKLSKNTIHPYENIVEISSIPKDIIAGCEIFQKHPIGLQIYDSTADAYYENGIVNDWLMYESCDDAMYNLDNFNFARDVIVQKIAICDHYKYSFTDITESLNVWANLGVIIAIDTIYLNGKHTLPEDVWRFNKRPCTINLLEAAADEYSPSDFEKMLWVGDITLRVPNVFINNFRKKDWQDSTTNIKPSVDYPYVWETDCIEIKKQSTISTLWTPPFILSRYESPGYTTYKFKVAQTQPETPDKDETWSDTPMYVPKGMYLWCSHKLIYEDSRIDTEWSDPTVMTDSDHMQVEYSSDYDGVTTLPKLDVSNGDFEQEWRSAAKAQGCGTWSDQPAGAIYMAVCRIVGDNTSEWTVMKVAGEDAYSLKLTNSTDQWYLDNGNWFGTASTTAYVYKGINQISATIEYSLDSKTWTLVTDGVIQIKASSVKPVVGNNSVIVRALIPNTIDNYLYKTFNVIGIQSDTGYEIVGVPSEIKHSDTWGYSPSIFYVNVHQEDINGRHVLSELPKGVYILLDIFGTDGDEQIECTPTESTKFPWAFDISNVTQNSKGTPKAFKLYISNTDNFDDLNRTIYDETYTVIVNDGKDGITKFKSTVFTRSVETPNKPEGGSFDDPNPDSDDIWKDGIVDGDAPIWSSYRWFSNETGFNDDWSEPVLMCDTPDFEVIYSSLDDITDCNPNNALAFYKDANGGIEGWLEETVLKDKWSDDGGTNSIWMATINKTKGKWGNWIISKIKGESGANGATKFKSTVFARSNNTPENPLENPYGGDFVNPNPENSTIWSDGIPDGNDPIWVSTRWFSNEEGFVSEWSTPVLMCDTPDFEVIYSSSEDITNCNPNDATVLKKDSDGGISGWLNENINVLDGKWSDDGDTNSIWMATIKKTNGEWGSWTVSKIKGEKGTGITIKGSYLSEEAFIDAIKANRFISINVGDAYIVAQKWIYVCPDGVNSINDISQFEKLQYTGEDGYGSEQIFILSEENSASAPSVDNYSAEVWNAPGFVPGDWKPSPQGVTDTHPYCFVSYRKTPYAGDDYNLFSAPVLYSKYSFDGQNAAYLEITNEFDQIWTNESNVPHTGQSWMTQVIYVNESGTITTLSEDNDDDIAIVRPENVLEYQWVGGNGTEQDNSSDNTYIKFSIKQDSISTIENDININIGYKGLIKTFTLKRLVGTTDYDLYVPTTYVSRSSDGKFGTESISVQITERQFGVNNSVKMLTKVPEGYTVYYLGGIDKAGILTLDHVRATYSGEAELPSFELSTYYDEGYRAFEIWLQKNNSDVIDTVRIQIVSDGKNGKDGANGGPGPQGAPGPIIYPAGVFSTEKTYKRINDTIPYVEYNNKYYICIGESTGATPDVDAENWSPMTQFDAVFTKLLVAENGTIGQAVYSGDYMFSQSGTNYDDDGTIIDDEGNCIEEIGTGTNYSKFWVYGNTPLFDQLFNEPKDRFVPSMLLDFKTGAGYFHHGDVRFDTNGVTIGSNVTIDADVKIGDFEVNKTNNFTYAKNGCWGYTLFDSGVTNINKLYAISKATSGKTLNLDANTLLSTYDAVEGRLIAAQDVTVNVLLNANNGETYTVDKFGCLNYIIYKDAQSNIRFQALNQFKIVNTTGTSVNEITIHFNLKNDGSDVDVTYVRVNMYDETKYLVYTGVAENNVHDYNGNSYRYIITLTSISSIKYIGIAASNNEDYSQGFFNSWIPFNSPVSGTTAIDIDVESL